MVPAETKAAFLLAILVVSSPIVSSLNDYALGRRVELISSPGNERHIVVLCHQRRIADTVADYLLENSVHDDAFQPIMQEYSALLWKICNEMSTDDPGLYPFHQQCSQLYSDFRNFPPSPFVNETNKYVTLHLENRGIMSDDDDTLDSIHIPVYLRAGYSHSESSSCVCARIKCSEEEYQAIDSYFSNTLNSLNNT